MSNEVDFEKESVALSREDWLQVAQDLMMIGPMLQDAIAKAANQYPRAAQEIPALDPEVFEADLRAACSAVAYVAEFATDECRFIVVKEDDTDG